MRRKFVCEGGIVAARDMYQPCTSPDVAPVAAAGDWYTVCGTTLVPAHLWSVTATAVQLVWLSTMVRLQAALNGRQ